MPRRKRKEKTEPTPPGEDVVEKIDPEHSDADFSRDLRKATTDKARKKLGAWGPRWAKESGTDLFRPAQ